MSTFGSSRSPRFSLSLHASLGSRAFNLFAAIKSKLPGEILLDQTTHLCLLHVCLPKKMFHYQTHSLNYYTIKSRSNNRISNQAFSSSIFSNEQLFDRQQFNNLLITIVLHVVLQAGNNARPIFHAFREAL